MEVLKYSYASSFKGSLMFFFIPLKNLIFSQKKKQPFPNEKVASFYVDVADHPNNTIESASPHLIL